MGRGQRALKAVQGLPNCAPHPVTEHRIQHFVYFSQLSAHKKGLDATRLSGHSLAALKQADKIRPLQTFLSLTLLLLLHWLTKNKAQRNTVLLQRAGSPQWVSWMKACRARKWAVTTFHSGWLLSEKRGKSFRKSTTPLISSDLSIVWAVVGSFFPLFYQSEKSFSWQLETKITVRRGWEFTGNNVFHQITK